MSYGIFEHKHNFAVWAAARATQRAFTTIENLKEALENCGIVEFLKTPESLNTGKEQFNDLHRNWCRSIVEHLRKRGVKNATFGRAAKLVAVYIKSMVVVGGFHDCTLARVAHPPIDRILLQNLANSPIAPSKQKMEWKEIKWTQLDEDRYYKLLQQLSSCLQKHEPMWSLERYWTVTSK
jgi:hypothetical protein